MTTIVTFSYDDAWPNFMTSASLMEQSGFRGTYFVQSNLIQGITWPQLNDLHSRGHEIAGHTINHFPLDDARGNQAWNEISGSRQQIRANVPGAEVDTFAFTYYILSAETAMLCEQAGYIGARAGGGGTEELPVIDGNNYMTRSWCLGRQEYLGWTTADLNNLVTEAVNKSAATGVDQWCCHTMHEIVGSQNGNANWVSQGFIVPHFEWLRQQIDNGAPIQVKTYHDAIAPHAFNHGVRYNSYKVLMPADSSMSLSGGSGGGIPMPSSPIQTAMTIGGEFEVAAQCFLTAYYWSSSYEARFNSHRMMHFALYEVRGRDVGRLVPGSEKIFGHHLFGGGAGIGQPYFWQRVPAKVPLFPGRRYRACAWNQGGTGPWMTEMPGNESFNAGVNFVRGPATMFRTQMTWGGQNSIHNGGTEMIYPEQSLNGLARGVDVEVSVQIAGPIPTFEPVSEEVIEQLARQVQTAPAMPG